jgi:hypothetical protein
MVEIAEQVCDDYEHRGQTGRPVFWLRDKKLIVADLERFLKEDSATAGESRHPAGGGRAGLRVARRTDLGTVASTFPTGAASTSKGKADRVDVAADGTSTSSTTRRANSDSST